MAFKKYRGTRGRKGKKQGTRGRTIQKGGGGIKKYGIETNKYLKNIDIYAKILENVEILDRVNFIRIINELPYCSVSKPGQAFYNDIIIVAVVDENEKIIGACSVRIVSDNRIFIDYLCTDTKLKTEFNGEIKLKGSGIGRQIINELKSYKMQISCQPIVGSFGFYTKMGFEKDLDKSTHFNDIYSYKDVEESL